MQRLRDEIKNDPVKYEEAKRKERERYHARKKAGKIKIINNMTPREQRKVRKNWREKSKKSYDLKKRKNELERKLEQDTPLASPNSPVLVQNVPSTSIANMFKNRRRKNRRELKKEIEHLKSQLKEVIKKKEKYKKRAQRSQISKLDTPVKNVKELTKGQHITPAVKRMLLYGKVVTKQLRENFKNKTKYRKVIASLAGKVVKKYRLMSEVGKICSVKMIRGATTEKKNKFNKLHRFLAIKNCVRSFLERDEHSRMCQAKRIQLHTKKIKDRSDI